MPFNTRVKTSLALAIAMLGGAAAHAAPLTYTAVSGPTIAWTVSGSTLSNGGPATLATLPTLLGGNAAAPGANVELNKFGGTTTPGTPVTTLSATGQNGTQFTFSSLTYADWFSPTGVATDLTKAYIQGAAQEANLTLTTSEFATAEQRFLSTNAWAAVSDPNLSYIDFEGNVLSVGLAGFISVYPILLNLFPAEAANISPTVQASEVVKVSVNGGEAQYLFGYNATPSGLTTADGTRSFTGNYEVTLQVPAEVPEPGSLALLGLGLFGLAAARRRKA